ncbi:MAG: hypothetical protein EOO06_00920 [Chitinophagaceae bacterium]|nr:MAG: hypothetical protein EOO06_00920 [Chitinophagaceae bacterium]
MNWNNFKDSAPTKNIYALICVKWPSDQDYTIEIDRWQTDCNDKRGGYWLGIEDHCEWVETVADGPGHCNRPVVSHWMVLPDKPEMS